MIELKVCTEGSCSNKGAYAVFRALAQAVAAAGLDDAVDLCPSGCLKDCNRGGVCVAIGEETFSVYAETADEFIRTIVKKRCG